MTNTDNATMKKLNLKGIRQIGRDPPHPHGNFRCRTLLCDVKEGAP